MKKLMCAIAAISVGVAMSDEEGFKSSANVVGYTTTTVKQGYPKTFAVTLTDVSNPTGPIAIDKLFTIDNIKATAAFSDGMDQIWRWDTTANNWAKYGYMQGRSAPFTTAAWRKWIGPKTSDFADLTDDDVINPGETFLYKRGGEADATLTLSGQVKEFTASPSYVLKQGYPQFIAYPWPVEILLSKLGEIATFSDIKATAAFSDGMDQIWRWDTTANNWAKYGYMQGRSAPFTTAAWRKWIGPKNSDFADLTDDDKIAAGEGFLYKRGGEADLTLTFKPLQSAE